MSRKKLQKPALQSSAYDLPIEVLDPLRAASYYSLKMPRPPQKLADYVDHYWVMRWDIPDGISFTAEIVPTAYINLTFMAEGARLTGVTTGKYRYDMSGKGTIVGAKFLPGGYRALSGQDAHLITDRDIPAQEVFAAATDQLNQQAIRAVSDDEAVKLLDKVLLARQPAVDSNVRLVQTIIDDIQRYDIMSVAHLLDRYALSERRLQELFRHYVGASPKWVMLRYRLLKAARMPLDGEVDNWTKVASELGYSDQSHFVNDFKRIIGSTPKQYASKIRGA